MADDREAQDSRRARILRAVVEEYIQTAQPVGSTHIAGAPGIGVSSATVRNDMAALEQDGYLHQPHTSAGRVPTEKGYRQFVDSLGDPRLGASEARQVRSFFAAASGALEGMLASTSRLLADLTHYAAVVVAPPHEASVIRSVQLVGLTPRVVLLVVVLANGVVEKHTIEFDDDVDDLRLGAATAALARLLTGRTLADLGSLDATDDAVVDAALKSLRAQQPRDGDQVFVGGAAQVASSFDAVGTVSEILRILEQQYVVVSLIEDVLDRGLQVAIGTETGMEPLAACSLVVAPYEVDGETAGSIGVLGPTRMNYSQALAAVAMVSKRLGNRLSEGETGALRDG